MHGSVDTTDLPRALFYYIYTTYMCVGLLRSTRSNHLLNHFSHGEYSLFQIGMYVIQGIVQHNSKKSDHSPLFQEKKVADLSTFIGFVKDFTMFIY